MTPTDRGMKTEGWFKSFDVWPTSMPSVLRHQYIGGHGQSILNRGVTESMADRIYEANVFGMDQYHWHGTIMVRWPGVLVVNPYILDNCSGN